MARPNRRPRPRRTCPECGEPLVAGGTYCRECGLDVAAVDADEAAGGFSDVELPEGYGKDDPSGFDYDEFLASEGLGSPFRRKRGKRLLFTIVALLAAAALLFGYLV